MPHVDASVSSVQNGRCTEEWHGTCSVGTVRAVRGLCGAWEPGSKDVGSAQAQVMADMFGGRPIWAHPNGVFGRRVCQHGRPFWQSAAFGHTLMVCLADASASMEDVLEDVRCLQTLLVFLEDVPT